MSTEIRTSAGASYLPPAPSLPRVPPCEVCANLALGSGVYREPVDCCLDCSLEHRIFGLRPSGVIIEVGYFRPQYVGTSRVRRSEQGDRVGSE
jgi:hypothetical protein